MFRKVPKRFKLFKGFFWVNCEFAFIVIFNILSTNILFNIYFLKHAQHALKRAIFYNISQPAKYDKTNDLFLKNIQVRTYIFKLLHILSSILCNLT